jgi:hypothetical protein
MALGLDYSFLVYLIAFALLLAVCSLGEIPDMIKDRKD